MELVTDKYGDEVGCSYCGDPAYHEFGGLCAECWLKCTDVERAALTNHPPPVKEIVRTEIRIPPAQKEIITYRTITTRIPPAWQAGALALWRAIVTVVALYSFAKVKGWL